VQRYGKAHYCLEAHFDISGKRSNKVMMKGYQAHLEKLRKDAAECALVRDLATDRARREMFDRSSGRLDQLADQMEREMNLPLAPPPQR